MSGIDEQEPRRWFTGDAAAFKVQERLRMAYAPGRTWSRPVEPPTRRARWRAWLRRWEVADRFPSGETSHIAYRFTRWGADWTAGTLNALLRHRDGHRVIVRRRR